MKKILPLFIFLTLQAIGKEIELKTTITDVTVFQTGAQIKRVGKTNIPAGQHEIVIRDATALLKEQSIQVKGEGNFTILSVNYQINYNNQKQDKSQVTELEAKEKELKLRLEDLSIKLEVIRTEEELINNLQSISTATEGVSVDQVGKAQDLLKTKLVLIKNEKLIISRQMNELSEQHQTVTQQLKTLKLPKQNVTYEIVIKITAKQETNAEFSLSYIVPNAKWFPTYDLRVKSVAEPMTIEYKANVTQQTGEDWNNVKLKLSTGDPSLSSRKPKIETWWLKLNEPYIQPQQQSNYYRYTDVRFTKVHGQVIDKETSEAIPFASVMVDGTNIGTTTDIDGSFSLTLPENARKLSVTYVGYQPVIVPIDKEDMIISLEVGRELEEVIATTPGVYAKDDGEPLNVRGGREKGLKYYVDGDAVIGTPNIAIAEFDINEKYSIASDPKNVTVNIQSIQSDVKYQYYCAPRLDKDVFLTAQMTNWEQYNLLEGQANVYFEGTFVGNTLLDTHILKDTLEFSLGRDKSVKVDRKKSKEYNKRTIFGSENIASRAWDITVRNGKQQNIDIIIEDQFPIAADSKIEVKQEEKSGGKLDEKTNVVTWRYLMEPAGTKQMQLKYTARYPKGTTIGLD
jgi:hypothetical protein